MSAIRFTVEFPDDVPPAMQEWPHTAAGLAAGRRWGRAMEQITPGATAMEPEWRCPDHGWEDMVPCESCGEAMCDQEAERSLREHGDILCEECEATQEKDCGLCHGSGGPFEGRLVCSCRIGESYAQET